MTRALLFITAMAAAAGYAGWVYSRMEVRVPGARILAGLRFSSLTLLAALLLDVSVPGSPLEPERWALVDVSASTGGDVATAVATRRAELEDAGWRVVPFSSSVGDGAAAAGSAHHTLLAPALARAAEAGAVDVLVVSDLRFHDVVAAESVLDRTGLHVIFERVEGGGTNAGITTFEFETPPSRGETVPARVEFFSSGPGPDSALLEIREEERLVASRRVALPAPGRRALTTVQVPSTRREGRVRYEATLRRDGDDYPADDRAAVYAQVDREEGALVLISLRPDWEPRVLQPVLGDASGLETRGFLRIGADRFAPTGRGIDRGAPVGAAAVRATAEGAHVLVVHGTGPDDPEWVATLVRRSPRVVLIPADEGTPGEWYVSSEVPASPVAGQFVGVTLQGLPPLLSVGGGADPAGGDAVLGAQLRGTGPLSGVLTLHSGPSGRVAVTRATGFWRWGMRGDGPRDVYRRLWSGVLGWLLEDVGVGSGTGEVRPDEWVTPPGEPVLWRVPGAAVDTVVVAVTRGDTLVAVDTLAGGGTVGGRILLPGTYAYTASAAGGGPRGAGRFDVASDAGEMLPLPRTPSIAGPEGATRGAAGGESRPLRTLPWMYLLVMALLSAEWVIRRRVGLR